MLQRQPRLLNILQRSSLLQRAFLTTDSLVVNPAGDFWSSIQVQDVPDSRPELEIARRHNTSLPYRPEQIIQGSIVHIDRDHVTIDTGHPVRTSFAKKELHLRQLVRSRNTGVREHERDFRVGDVLHFMLEELMTPFGDIGLRVYRPNDADRLKMLWQELTHRFETQTPVKGRILNSVFGGYAVGIAGIVGLLRDSEARRVYYKNIGILQDFYIREIDNQTQRLVVGHMESEQQGYRGARVERGGQASLKWSSMSRDTLVKPRILALIAAANAASPGPSPASEVPAALQEALQLCENGGEMKKDQAFTMLQQLKEQARPDVFNAVWSQLQRWNFDFKGLILDGKPVVDTRRMVEMRSTKPAQRLGWEAAAKGTVRDREVQQRRETGNVGGTVTATPKQVANTPEAVKEGELRQLEKHVKSAVRKPAPRKDTPK